MYRCGFFWRWLLSGLLVLTLAGCGRSRAVKEPPITGKSSDPPVTIQPRWESGKRYLYRVDVSTTAVIPRRVTGKPIRAETTLGQDLSFSVTNTASGGDGRVIRMELMAVQMQTARDDGLTMTFDSDNPVIFVEDSALAERLQKLIGLKMTFYVTGENRVTRVDGMKDLSDRLSSGTSVRGVAGNVLNRFFNQQFYRDIVEMGLLPRDPIKVSDKWTSSRQVSGGLWGGSAQLDLNYEFRGWQRREGTNCIRLDFTGTLKPPGTPPAQPGGRRPVVRPSSSLEQGTVSGQCWYNPELALAIDTVYELSLATRSTSVKRTTSRPASGSPGAPGSPGATNQVVTLEADVDELESTTPSPPPPSGATPPTLRLPLGAPTNLMTGVTVTTTTNTTSSSSQWHTNVRLLEIEPIQ